MSTDAIQKAIAESREREELYSGTQTEIDQMRRERRMWREALAVAVGTLETISKTRGYNAAPATEALADIARILEGGKGG